MWHAVLGVGFGALLLAIDFPPVSEHAFIPGPDWARLLVLVALGALQLLWDRAPITALLAGLPLLGLDAAMGVSLAALLGFGDLLYLAVLHGSRRGSRAVLAAVWVFGCCVAVVALVVSDTLRDSVLIVLGVCPLPVLPVWWALNVRQQREIAEAERARADQLAQIAELDRAAAVYAERASMARDLHDVIAGHLSAIAIQSEALLTLPDSDPARVRGVLRSVRENSVASLSEMHAMIGLLRSGEGHPDGPLAPARLRELDALVRSARAAGLAVSCTVDGVDDLPAAVDLSAYRIVQEALTNAVKHAPGSQVSVCVRRERGMLEIEVRSDGRPAAHHAGGTGLISMAERADAVGGVLKAGPCAEGWRVRTSLPLERR
ncbi:two-component sensor histidine kinase [Actinokineospora sp. NBRC 105648]|nr:two-component sensor histidine kinase [Actinokineospora sp. NBRC 105648]